MARAKQCRLAMQYCNTLHLYIAYTVTYHTITQQLRGCCNYKSKLFAICETSRELQPKRLRPGFCVKLQLTFDDELSSLDFKKQLQKMKKI